VRTHFDNVGFALPTREHLTALIRRTAREGVPVDAPHGRYFRWAPGAGIELWVGVDPQQELTGFNPHLSGRGRITVRVDRMERDRQAPLTGTAHGTLLASSGEPMPISLDLPDFDLSSDAKGAATFQVAAFAHELHVFPDEAAYNGSGAARPIRTLEPVADDEEERSDVIMAGIALDAEGRENPVTGARFHWILAETVGGTVDVVADPEIMSGPPVSGGIVYGEFWLSGRVLRSDDALPMPGQTPTG
jgi:hypothetical protein